MAALGLPDIAPPPPFKPQTSHAIQPNVPQETSKTIAKPRQDQPAPDTLAKRLEGVETNLEVTKAQMLADMEADRFAATLNQAAEINAALAPQRSYEGRPEDHSDDEIVQLLERGYLPIEIARMWNASPSVLIKYMKAEPARFARVTEARIAGGQAADAKAMEILRTATPETAYKARAIAAFLQWRASRLSPEYVDQSRVKVDANVTVTHVEPERAPITDLIAEALKPFTPPPRMIDVDAEPH